LFTLTVDRKAFRDTLSYFASGVCVVTAVADGGTPVGVTISAFTSLSLDPPLVLFCLGNKTTNLEAFTNGGGFAVNILAEDQGKVSEIFASQSNDKFASIPFTGSESGCPLLPGCLASLECTLVSTHDGGDHVIVVGKVDRVRKTEGSKPLLRYRGNYSRVGNTI
jgi:flavin reductase (DIM6/NTAB) family NADH-FMN oxidoreductase RutF